MPQNSLWVKKCDFFKVQDNDTTIRLGEKEGQTDVSSALKRFYDHLSLSWKNFNISVFDFTLTTLWGFPYRIGKGEVKKSKNGDFSMKCSDDRKTFLGPN